MLAALDLVIAAPKPPREGWYVARDILEGLFRGGIDFLKWSFADHWYISVPTTFLLGGAFFYALLHGGTALTKR